MRLGQPNILWSTDWWRGKCPGNRAFSIWVSCNFPIPILGRLGFFCAFALFMELLNISTSPPLLGLMISNDHLVELFKKIKPFLWKCIFNPHENFYQEEFVRGVFYDHVLINSFPDAVTGSQKLIIAVGDDKTQSGAGWIETCRFVIQRR